VSLKAHVADAAFAVKRSGLEPVVVVSQSLGGLTAMLLTAQRSDLVRAVVLVARGPRCLAALAGAFPSHKAAVEFFGGPWLAATPWAVGWSIETAAGRGATTLR